MKRSSLQKEFVNLRQKSFRRMNPGACIIKLFTIIINSVVQKASVLTIVTYFLLALTNKLGFYVMELITAVKFLRYRPQVGIGDF